MERCYALTDAQWERLQSLGFPGSAGHVGRPAKDARLFLEAVLFRFDLALRGGTRHHGSVIGTGYMQAFIGGVKAMFGKVFSSN